MFFRSLNVKYRTIPANATVNYIVHDILVAQNQSLYRLLPDVLAYVNL